MVGVGPGEFCRQLSFRYTQAKDRQLRCLSLALSRYRPLCRSWTRFCPSVMTDRCALQYVAGSNHDELRQSLEQLYSDQPRRLVRNCQNLIRTRIQSHLDDG